MPVTSLKLASASYVLLTERGSASIISTYFFFSVYASGSLEILL